jgi:hypothetical protein
VAVGLGYGIGNEIEVGKGRSGWWWRWKEKKERLEERAAGLVEIEEDMVDCSVRVLVVNAMESENGEVER